MTIRNGLFSSESVSEGHPDKLADRISDRILDAFLARDPKARVACETMLADQFVIVAGEFKTRNPDDFHAVQANADSLVREVLRETGYTNAETGIDPERCQIKICLLYTSSGAYALSALLRVLDIVASDTVPTAAVECKLQPRLLINPEFVEKHADTPEKLLMLVMHELHHVLLGHTTLFPRATRVQNFVFDAVINGLLCRMFPQPEHTAFFTDLYSADRFPECLLRPAPGWPLKPKPITQVPQEVPEEMQKQVVDLHRALYSETGASYQEVYDVLPKLLISVERLGQDLDDIPLVGNCLLYTSRCV